MQPFSPLVLEGRQDILELIYNNLLSGVLNIDVSENFPEADLNGIYSRILIRDYSFIQLLSESYKTTLNENFVRVKNALISGSGYLFINPRTRSGLVDVTNPLFTNVDRETGDSGLMIPIDLSKFTPEKLSRIVWALGFDGSAQWMQHAFNDIKVIENVESQITEPIRHLYKVLYDMFKNYFESFYSGTRSDFSVGFYQPSLSGMSANSRLGNTLTEINPMNEADFRRKVASIIYNMVKYVATIVVKEGSSRSWINILYANLLGVLDETYMKTNFYMNTVDTIGGSLDNNEVWKNSNSFAILPALYRQGAFTLQNLYPIFKFSDADNFDQWFISLMNGLAKETGKNGIFPTFKDASQLYDLKG